MSLARVTDAGQVQSVIQHAQRQGCFRGWAQFKVDKFVEKVSMQKAANIAESRARRAQSPTQARDGAGGGAGHYGPGTAALAASNPVGASTQLGDPAARQAAAAHRKAVVDLQIAQQAMADLQPAKQG